MYEISYHKLVLKEDLKKLNRDDQNKILKAIQKKLSRKPDVFGKALRDKLKGYFRIRVGHFRVIYRIHEKKVEVFVLNIGMRRNSEVYIEAAKRLGLI
jgi:mRNA interferase RelE/StbE